MKLDAKLESDYLKLSDANKLSTDKDKSSCNFN